MLQARFGLQEQQMAVQKQAQQLHQAAQRLPAAPGVGGPGQSAVAPSVSAPVTSLAPIAAPATAQAKQSMAMQS